MTQIFESYTFEYFDDRLSKSIFSDIDFINCRFHGCNFSAINLPNFENVDMVDRRSTARNIRFINCEVGLQSVGAGIVEDVLLDGLRVRNHFQSHGTAFRHVTIKGSIDKLMLTPYVDSTGGRYQDIQNQFDEANRRFYETVDWALDISEAKFKDCDIRAIPAKLIRRDPLTQVVLRREKAMQGKWREIDLSKTHWGVSIEFFLEGGYQDCVLVAPKRAPNYKLLLEGLNRLRDAGIVEPD